MVRTPCDKTASERRLRDSTKTQHLAKETIMGFEAPLPANYKLRPGSEPYATDLELMIRVKLYSHSPNDGLFRNTAHSGAFERS